MFSENGRSIDLLAREKHAELLREAKNEQLVSLALNDETRTPALSRLWHWIETRFRHEPVAINTRDAKCAAC
jgi:hypothetical protein